MMFSTCPLNWVLGGEDAEQLWIVPVAIPVKRDELGQCGARAREVQRQRFLCGHEIGSNAR